RVAPVRYVHGQLVPQPLAGRREVEVVALDGVAVGEGDLPAGGVSGIRPVAGLTQYRVEHAELDHFAADAVDLHPVADAHAVRSHEHEPADEGDDEALQGHREAGGRQPDHGADLSGAADQHEEDDQDAENLQHDADHAAQGAELAAIDDWRACNQLPDPA